MKIPPPNDFSEAVGMFIAVILAVAISAAILCVSATLAIDSLK